MASEMARASSPWLALREAADAEARDAGLVDELRELLPADRVLRVHDLGCGTGSMARWLAALLDGPQDWLLHDRDADLLARAADHPPGPAAGGAPVTATTRLDDVTRLATDALGGADLVTASALLDMLTAAELRRLVAVMAGPGCPVLVTLSVVGRVELWPADPLDRQVQDAFNAHQRRSTPAGRLLGPHAVALAVDGLRALGRDVLVRPSPWRLGAARSALATEWFTGWWAAAVEQRPELEVAGGSYARRRLAACAEGSLRATVHHVDLLARPAP